MGAGAQRLSQQHAKRCGTQHQARALGSNATRKLLPLPCFHYRAHVEHVLLVQRLHGRESVVS